MANKTGKKLKNLKDKASAILRPLAINAARPGFIELGGGVGQVATKEAAEKIAAAFKGATLKGAQNEKGWRVSIPNGRKKLVVRIMEAGSGERKNPYFRIGIDGKSALTSAGELMTEPELTHIDLTSDYLRKVQEMIIQYKIRYKK